MAKNTGDSKKPVCPSCGKTVSRKGRYCRSCFFSNISFREKLCKTCGKSFIPKSGVDAYCDYCRSHCIDCGKKLVYVRKTVPGRCRSCGTSIRKYVSVCSICEKEFNDTNGQSKLCKSCRPNNGFCIDCGKEISRKAIRCNPCARSNSVKNGVYSGRGRHRYKYNGIMFRSKWEIEFAKILDSVGISYEYEKYEPISHTLPDFYIPEIDLYVEIHPIYFGKKKTIEKENYILVETLSQTKALAYALSWKLRKETMKNIIDSMSKKKLIGTYDSAINTALYLRQIIFEKYHE